MTTPELIEEILDGPPDRRVAAISVIDLDEVPQPMVEDWIRTLPNTEAHELAGAIPAQRYHATTEEDLRWVRTARLGYERRRLATFLVMLFSSVEAIESKDPVASATLWTELAPWVAAQYRAGAAANDEDLKEDLGLFVLENYLDRPAMLTAFIELVGTDPDLALRVSANPGLYLTGVPLDRQRETLMAAEAGGGLPMDKAWRALHEPTM